MNAALATVRMDEVLAVARSNGASDVHLIPGYPPAMRVDGALRFENAPAVTADETRLLAQALLDGESARRLVRCGDAGAALDDGGARARVHAVQSSRGIALAIRILAPAIPALESLALPGAVGALASRSHGLAIFTGPTGSGKSTAIAALLDRINRTQARRILTVEDPIEYVHTSVMSVVSQREIGRDARSFDEAVQAALRCDPDVLVIGEMRDRATMRAAIGAAETGHLVLATLHTADASQTIDRIAGTFADGMQEQMRGQLAQTLAAVVCMRLVPRLRGGRRAAAEVLLGSDAARALIREGKTHQLRHLMETSRSSGMQTLESHLSELVARGEISRESAYAACVRERELERSLGDCA